MNYAWAYDFVCWFLPIFIINCIEKDIPFNKILTYMVLKFPILTILTNMLGAQQQGRENNVIVILFCKIVCTGLLMTNHAPMIPSFIKENEKNYSVSKQVVTVVNYSKVCFKDHAKLAVCNIWWVYRADFRFAPSQWEMALLCNSISNWLGTSLDSALGVSGNWVCCWKELVHLPVTCEEKAKSA